MNQSVEVRLRELQESWEVRKHLSFFCCGMRVLHSSPIQEDSPEDAGALHSYCADSGNTWQCCSVVSVDVPSPAPSSKAEVALKTVKAVPQNEEELSTLKEYVGPPGGAGIVKKMVINTLTSLHVLFSDISFSGPR